MGRIKGAAIRARLEFLKAAHGEEPVSRAISSLDPMDQVILSGTLLPSIWYPFHVLANLDEAVTRELGGASSELFESAGQHVARQHARSIYKVFFRESEPDKVLKLATCIFANYWSGLGRVTVKPSSGGTTRVQVSDAPVSSRSHCSTTLSYFRTVLEECCQVPVTARESRCRCWGDDACEFEYGWESALRQAI